MAEAAVNGGGAVSDDAEAEQPDVFVVGRRLRFFLLLDADAEEISSAL